MCWPLWWKYIILTDFYQSPQVIKAALLQFLRIAPVQVNEIRLSPQAISNSIFGTWLMHIRGIWFTVNCNCFAFRLGVSTDREWYLTSTKHICAGNEACCILTPHSLSRRNIHPPILEISILTWKMQKIINSAEDSLLFWMYDFSHPVKYLTW